MLFSLWQGIEKAAGHIEQPQWSEVEEAVLTACARNNSVRLYLKDGPLGQDILSCATSNGNYLLDFYLNTSVDDEVVISLTNPNWESENMLGLIYQDHSSLGRIPMVEIGGNHWDARSVTADIDVVKSVFKEFFETGKISHPWMTD